MKAIELTEEQARRLFSSLSNGHEQAMSLPVDIQIHRLKDHFADYANKHTFKPGDLVRSKPGLEFFRYPAKGQPSIVMEVLSQPYLSKGKGIEQGSTIDIRIGCFADEKTFMIYAFDSALFEPWTD